MKTLLATAAILAALSFVPSGLPVADANQTKERKEVKVDPKIYDAYVGTYEINPNVAISITKEEDKLMGQAAGKPKIQLSPESESQFFVKGIDLRIEFVKDEDERVTHLVLFDTGKELKAKKTK